MLILVIITFVIILDNSNENVSKNFKFKSLKFSRVNMRSGPGREYPILITYKKISLPVKILDNYNNWYKVEDIYHNQGWIAGYLMNNEQFGIIISEKAMLKKFPKDTSKYILYIRNYNIVKLINCNNNYLYCKVAVSLPEYNTWIKGWINKRELWGNIFPKSEYK